MAQLAAKLLGCSGLVTLLAAAPADFRLLVNDSPVDRTFLLQPGHPNRLSTQAPSSVTNCYLKVTRELPTGEKLVDQQLQSVALGPMAAPPVYLFKNGQVLFRGYELSVELWIERKLVQRWEFRQTLSDPDPSPHPYPWWHMSNVPARPLRFSLNAPRDIPYNLTSRSLGPLSLRLDESVLDDQDDVRIHLRLNPGGTPATLLVHLRITNPNGQPFWTSAVTLDSTRSPQAIPIHVRSWPSGDYRIELLPELDRRVWPDGVSITYRRRAVTPNTVVVSPLAPWTLQRDAARPERLLTKIDNTANIQCELTGTYAIFAQVEQEDGLFVQAGERGLVRLVRPNWRHKPTFLEATDLTGKTLRILPNGPAGDARVTLRLVPVTATSVAIYYQETGHPPVPTYAVDDWLNSFGTGGPTRTTPDQIELISCTAAELGSRSIGWSVGRSWIEYKSVLPNQHPFPCVPWEEAQKSPHYPKSDTWDYGPRIRMQQQEFDPLAVVLESRSRCNLEIWPWLAMQRHYGVNFYGGMFACPFYRDNKQWWRYAKDGSHAAGLSFYFPEVRAERIAILLETAQRGADGLLVGCDRQAPMLLYDPAMADEYRRLTGVDARKIDASNRQQYEAWIRWRANFFTQLLRDLKRELAPIRAQQKRAIPVAVRFPVAGLFLNLAQGIDIETWCREGLISRMQLDPLEDLAGKGSQDIRPYLELGRRYGIEVIGGVGGTGFIYEPPPGASPGGPVAAVAGLRRALGLIRAGVQGVDTYETNAAALSYEGRFLLPLLGNPKRLEEFLRDSNLDACYPVDAGNAAGGHDNHSRWDRGWTVYGFTKNSL